MIVIDTVYFKESCIMLCMGVSLVIIKYCVHCNVSSLVACKSRKGFFAYSIFPAVAITQISAAFFRLSLMSNENVTEDFVGGRGRIYMTYPIEDALKSCVSGSLLSRSSSAVPHTGEEQSWSPPTLPTLPILLSLPRLSSFSLLDFWEFCNGCDYLTSFISSTI